jgi:hypothetical protein
MADKKNDRTALYAIEQLKLIIGQQAVRVGELSQENDELRASLESSAALIKELQKGGQNSGTEQTDTGHE